MLFVVINAATIQLPAHTTTAVYSLRRRSLLFRTSFLVIVAAQFYLGMLLILFANNTIMHFITTGFVFKIMSASTFLAVLIARILFSPSAKLHRLFLQ